MAGRSLGSSIVFVILLLAVAGFLGLPTPATHPPSIPTDRPAAIPATNTTITITQGSYRGTETPDFWGTLIGGNQSDSSTIAKLLKATPIKSLQFGADQIEAENWSTGCLYQATPVGGVCNPSNPDYVNPVDFAHLCQLLPTDLCTVGLPAEINDASTATYLAHWLVTNTSWTPTCWAIGNEPRVWTQFSRNWTSWNTVTNSTPSSAQFDTTALNYTDALRHAFPSTCIIGIEMDSARQGVFTTPWIYDLTTAVPNVTAVAFHAYPNEQCANNENLTDVLSPTNLTAVATDYQNVSSNLSAHPLSAGLPIDVSEFGLGLLAGCSKYLGTPTEAVFVAANAAQALSHGIPQFTFFRFYCSASDCMWNSTTNTSTAVYQLYSGLLTHMSIDQIYERIEEELRNQYSLGFTPDTSAGSGFRRITVIVKQKSMIVQTREGYYPGSER